MNAQPEQKKKPKLKLIWKILIAIAIIFVGIMILGYCTYQADQIPLTEAKQLEGTWQSGEIYFDFNPDLTFESVVSENYISGTYEVENENFTISYGSNTEEFKNVKFYNDTFEADLDDDRFVYTRIPESDFLAAVESSNANETAEVENPETTDTEEETAPAEDQKRYTAGTYKIGTDMPAGIYLVKTTGKSGYFAITSDSSGELGTIIDNNNFEVQDYIEVFDGEYLKLSSGTYAEPVNENTAYNNNIYFGGSFKVGTDIPAGEYQVIADKSGYWARLNGPYGLNREIIANENFEGSTYVTVNDGEYLVLSNDAMITPVQN